MTTGGHTPANVMSQTVGRDRIELSTQGFSVPAPPGNTVRRKCNMSPTNRIFKALIYLAAWLIGEAVVVAIVHDAPARNIYAGIVAWWLAAYVAAKVAI